MFREHVFEPKTLTMMFILGAWLAILLSFAASNTVPESGAGYGMGDISSFTIDNIHYMPLPEDPTKLTSLTLSVNKSVNMNSAMEVRVSVDNGNNWSICTNLDVDQWKCSFTTGSEPSISGMQSLRVIAVQ